MRMYNPEWEAIKDFAYTPRYVDVQFDISGAEIPADHGVSLFEALARHLPWLRHTSDVGVHPIHGAPTGRNDNLVINRRVKLVLRVPVERLGDVRALVGKEIDPGAGSITIGPLKEKRLSPFATLYSHFVDMGHADEAEFMAEARRMLDEMQIQGGLIPGKKRKMRAREGELVGYSLMLHGVSLIQSLALQEQGLGLHRNYGCGIFIPHRSIREVVID